MGDAHGTERRNPACAFSYIVRDGIAELLFDLPGEKLNILSAAVMNELGQTVTELSGRKDIRCLLLKSGKPGSFIAGANLHEIAAVSDTETAATMAGAGQAILNALDDLPFPTIAVIHGVAVGGGLEMALACDYRVVTDDPRTKLSLPETTLGILPGFGGTYRLPRIIGLTQAVRMILTGSPVDGARAEKMGLADACWPAAFLEDKTAAFITKVLAAPHGTMMKRRRRRPLATAFAEGTPLGRALLFRAARKDLLARTGGHYPAPLAALRVLQKTVHARREKALAMERDTIARLLPTEITRNMVRLFFAQEAAKKTPAPEGAAPSARGSAPSTGSSAQPARAAQPLRSAAVLGAGVMGGRIAWLFAKAGIPVVMKDIAWEPVRKGYETALDVFRELEKKRRLTARETNLGMHRISGAVDYGSLGNPDIVLEAVVENIAIKKKVLAEVEARVGEKTLLASNTSSLSITEMAGALRAPSRFVGMHFFNPPNRMPLVEVVPGAATGVDAVAMAVKAALMLGKTPIVVKDCPGFLVNRLLMPYLNECVRLVEEGNDFVAVDRLLVGFGMPMGPFTLLDEIGLDIAREVGRVLATAYGVRMPGSDLLDSLAGRNDLLGKKTVKGFYLHGKGKRAPNPEMQRLIGSQRKGSAVKLAAALIVDRPLLAMVNEASRALQEGVAASAQDVDLALILGTGFPAFRGGLLRWADQRGVSVVRDALAGMAEKNGKRFTPSPLLEQMASEKKGFYAEG
jgi:3-hydroxyacyl-CoA dehydrogenase / enoyl-CoA hydratase / 3-hydroxybutyryl-CoA epimerase